MEYGNSLKYLFRLVKSFGEKQENDYMIIKNYNTLFLPEDVLRAFAKDVGEDYCFLYYRFQKQQMVEPYQPFLGWIREVYHQYFHEETPEQFVENANVYPLQRYSFARYIETGKSGRCEDFLLNELEYERKRIMDSIRNLYTYISRKKKIFIVIEGLHLIGLSGLKALYHLLVGEKNGDIKFFATYNESYYIPDYIYSEWEKFVKAIEKKNCQYEWGEIESTIHTDLQDNFSPLEGKIDEYLTTASNMYYFLAYEDAQFYLNYIYEKIEQDRFRISQEKYAYFLQIYALVELYCKEEMRLLQICEQLGSLALELQDDRILYNYYYICVMTQLAGVKDANKIEDYIQECIQIAKRLGDEVAEYKPELLKILYTCNYWRENFRTHYEVEIDDKFLNLTEDYGYKNILAYLCIYCFETSEEDVLSIANYEKEAVYFNRGIKLATELENYELLISAYTKGIMVFSKYGCYDYVGTLFQKKVDAIQIENNFVRMVHAYNGMGYNASVIEKYQLAEEYYSESLVYLLKQDSVEEIAITLYNSALNKILAEEYAYAEDDLLLLIRIIEALGVQALAVGNVSKFYAMLGICSFYLDKEYRCLYCLNRVEAYVCHLNDVEDEGKYHDWSDILFLQEILWAMLCVREEKFKQAEKRFVKAKFYMDLDKQHRFLNYPFYVREVAKLYKILGEDEAWETILKEGIDFCNENKFYLRGNSFSFELLKMEGVKKKDFVLKRTVTSEQILETVERLLLQKNLESRKKDILFLTTWQQLLGKESNIKVLMPKALKLLKNHFQLDGIFMFVGTDEKIELAYMDCPNERERVDGVYHFTEGQL